jgi:hypothetical protein
MPQKSSDGLGQEVDLLVASYNPSHGTTSRGGSNLLEVLRGHSEGCRWATDLGSRDGFARLKGGLEVPRFYGVRPCDGSFRNNRASPIFMGLGGRQNGGMAPDTDCFSIAHS